MAARENLRLVGFVGEDWGEGVARVSRRFLGEKEGRRARGMRMGMGELEESETEIDEGVGPWESARVVRRSRRSTA